LYNNNEGVREDENVDNEDDDLPCAMRERLHLAKLAKYVSEFIT